MHKDINILQENTMKNLSLRIAMKIAKSVCAGSPEEEAYYTISDVVDEWENNHKQDALTILAYEFKIQSIMSSYKEIKIICGNYDWVEKNILPKVAKYIISYYFKRNKDFMKGLQRWNKEHGKCFINDFLK